MTLSPKHQRFVAEYLKDQCASAAAVRAGYAGGQSAEVQGSRLLSNVKIRAEIDKLLAKATEAAGLSAAKVREAWRKVIDADVRKLFDAEGKLVPIHQLGENEAALLGGLEITQANLDPTDGKRDLAKVLKYRLWDRAKYTDQAAKHLGMYVEKVEVSLGEDCLAMLLEGRKRAVERRAHAQLPERATD